MRSSPLQIPSQVQVVHTATKVQGIATKHSESLDKPVKQLDPPTLEILPSEPLMTQEYPKQPTIVDGLIPTGLIIVAGEPKVGKSCAMLNLVFACASLGACCVGSSPSVSIAFEPRPLEVPDKANHRERDGPTRRFRRTRRTVFIPTDPPKA